MTTHNRKHGIYSYKHLGCRCAECCLAHEKYLVRYRKNPEKAPMIDPEPLIAFIVGRGEPITASIARQFDRWRRNGVDMFIADGHCVRRGYHPYEVFGEAWYQVPAVESPR